MKLLFDFLPVVLFFAAYKMFGSLSPEVIQMVNQLPYVELSQSEPRHAIIFATLVLVVGSIIQNMVNFVMHKRLEKVHLFSLALLLVLGSLTVIFKNPDFLKWKVSVLNWIFAAILLGSLWIGQKTIAERMMSSTIAVPDQIWRNVTLLWGAFFFMIGVLNVIVAFYFPGENDTNWVNFKLFGILGLTIVFIIAQAVYLGKHALEDDEIAKEV